MEKVPNVLENRKYFFLADNISLYNIQLPQV